MISVDYTSYNILEDESMDEVVYDYCEKMWKKSDYSSVDDMLSSVIAIEYFPSPTYKDLVTQFYAQHGEHIEDKVRGYLEYKRGFLMEHGCGYDWVNEDIYSRRKIEFLDWLSNKGFQLVED